MRNPEVEKSNTTNIRTATRKSQLAIDVLEEELGLVDIWRHLCPQDREYTFYSNPHTSYSRIDYFLTSKQLVDLTVSTSIGNVVLPDHAPVEIVLHFGSLEAPRPRSRWRLNTSLHHNEKSCNFIGRNPGILAIY